MGVSLRWEEHCSAHQIWDPGASWRVGNQTDRTLPKDALKRSFLVFFLNCPSGVTPQAGKHKINVRYMVLAMRSFGNVSLGISGRQL